MRISRFARRDVLIVTAKNLCEIALSAMEALEVAWKHVLVDQDRQQLIDVRGDNYDGRLSGNYDGR